MQHSIDQGLSTTSGVSFEEIINDLLRVIGQPAESFASGWQDTTILPNIQAALLLIYPEVELVEFSSHTVLTDKAPPHAIAPARITSTGTVFRHENRLFNGRLKETTASEIEAEVLCGLSYTIHDGIANGTLHPSWVGSSKMSVKVVPRAKVVDTPLPQAIIWADRLRGMRASREQAEKLEGDTPVVSTSSPNRRL